MLLVAIVIIAFLVFLAFVIKTWFDHKSKKRTNDTALREATELLRRNEEKSFRQTMDRLTKEDGFAHKDFLILAALFLAIIIVSALIAIPAIKVREPSPVYGPITKDQFCIENKDSEVCLEK